MSDDQWWQLREVVLAAASSSRTPPPLGVSDHPVIRLVRQFLETNNDSFINEAAKTLAQLKPGVSHDVADKNYWLVLDKS